jgi:hypothetical protein
LNPAFSGTVPIAIVVFASTRIDADVHDVRADRAVRHRSVDVHATMTERPD